MPVDVGELEIVNVCPARGPVLIVPVSTPVITLVQLPSSFTVYVNEKLKSSELALLTLAGIVIPIDEPLTVPVPSRLNVRIPSTADDCPKEPSVGVKLGLNPGPGAAVTRQAAEPVNPYSPLSLGGSAAAFVTQVTTKIDTDHNNARRMELSLYQCQMLRAGAWQLPAFSWCIFPPPIPAVLAHAGRPFEVDVRP